MLGLAVPPDRIPLLLLGAGMAGLAAWVLVLDRKRAASQAFAAVLLNGALYYWLDELADAALKAGNVAIAERLFTGVLVLAPFGFLAAIWLASVFPRPRGPFAHPRAGLFVVLAGGALGVAMLLAPQLGSIDLERAEVAGPIGVAVSIVPAYTALAFVFAIDLLREPPGPLRRLLLLMSLAWGLVSFASTGAWLVSLAAGAPLWTNANAGLLRILALATLSAFASGAILGRDDEARRLAIRGLAIGWLALACGAAAVLLARVPGLEVARILLGLPWILARPLLATYAILKLGLFDIDVKVRWTVKQSTIGAAFIAVFFVVSEGASIFFGEDNPYFGVVAAGALVFALAPLQRVAERVATATVPGAVAATMAGGHRAAFRSAVELALADGAINRDEERALARHADVCGLTSAEAWAIRDEVEREKAAAPRL